MPKTDTSHADVKAWLRNEYPDAQWQLIDDLARAANWELWCGPMPDDYWVECDPLETPWPGWVEACDLLSTALEDLPGFVFYDNDAGGVIGTRDPVDEQDNYCSLSDLDEDVLNSRDREVYCGPDDYSEILTIDALIPTELRQYVR